MNKRGMGFYVLMGIMALFLVGYGYKIIVIDPLTDRSYIVGEGLLDLIESDSMFRNIENFYDYSLKFSVLNALDKYSAENPIRDKNPDETVEEDLKLLIEEDFLKRMASFQEQIKSQRFSYVFPQEYSINIVRNLNSFIVELSSDEEFRIMNNQDSNRNSPEIVLYDKLEFEGEVDFDLDIFSELYEKYSGYDDNDCRYVRSNELFEDTKVSCDYNGEFLNFEVETKDLGLIKPVIKFKIRKPDEIEFTSDSRLRKIEENGLAFDYR